MKRIHVLPTLLAPASVLLVLSCTTALPSSPSGGEGEGSAGEGEGEGVVTGEGEGSGGEGEGSVGEGEGEGTFGGEGEGSHGGEGEGEGSSSAPTCTSGHHWLLGDLQTDLMHPGLSCISCHATHSNAPHFAAAGTVMGGIHDDDDCHGTSGVTVHVTGADGVVHDATTNFNGNFDFAASTNIPMPYHAEIEVNGQVRAMLAAQTVGDCMSCHTEQGANGAPGRIVIPGVAIP